MLIILCFQEKEYKTSDGFNNPGVDCEWELTTGYRGKLPDRFRALS